MRHRTYGGVRGRRGDSPPTRLYFWIPDIPPAAEFRNDGASRATIPE